MKTILFAVAALAPLSMTPALAYASGTSVLWPSAKDRAICDPIFAKLQQTEGGETLMAQADNLPEASSPISEPQEQPSEEDLAAELTAMLQACSYDGKAVTLNDETMKSSDGSHGLSAVSKIMRFTGLPQNFTIMEGDVANAAAVITLGHDGNPRRVIAYSPKFMQQVVQATGKDGWPGTSILAHEIGHHLAGHTLMPGGSQPPIELEADKFSGFVLFKMGASLEEAGTAIATLIPEADGPTHPGRQKRLKAVHAGWLQSCEQQQQVCGDEAVVAASAQRNESLPPQIEEQPSRSETSERSARSDPDQASAQMPDIPGPLDIQIPDLSMARKEIGPAVIDQIPRLETTSTPSKFDRFVYDEVGVFDPTVRDELQRIAFRFAAAANVEVVTVVAKDLQGREPDQFALDFMRQMRVGKMDVGNGAVLVVAPNTNQVGMALGPGLLVLFENDGSPLDRLDDFIKLVAGGGDPQRVSSTISGAAYRVMNQAKALDWVVRFPSFETYQAANQTMLKDRGEANTPYDPGQDLVANQLLRLDAALVDRAPDISDRTLMVNEPRTRHIGPAMQVRTARGEDIVLYVSQTVERLMPVPLEEGRRYSFIARDTILNTGAPQLDLISYDLLE
jgi:hypothetical protein